MDETSQVIKTGRNLFNLVILKSKPPGSNRVFSNITLLHCGMKIHAVPLLSLCSAPTSSGSILLLFPLAPRVSRLAQPAYFKFSVVEPQHFKADKVSHLRAEHLKGIVADVGAH